MNDERKGRKMKGECRTGCLICNFAKANSFVWVLIMVPGWAVEPAKREACRTLSRHYRKLFPCSYINSVGSFVVAETDGPLYDREEGGVCWHGSSGSAGCSFIRKSVVGAEVRPE